MKRSLFYCICLLWLTTPSVWAEDIRVTSTIDKRTAYVNEEIHLTIRITGARGNIQAPRLPGFEGFDTFYTGRSSQITFVNNRSSSSVEFSYVLVPQYAGRFPIKGLEVIVSGRTFRTDPVEIEILEDARKVSRRPTTAWPKQTVTSGQSSIREPTPDFEPADDNIFVRATVDKTTIYPNEQVLLTYMLYTRYDTRYEGFEEEPEVSGFWIEEFPPEREVRRETVRVGGRRYVKAEVKKLALFPTAAAEYTIQPGTIKVSIRQEPRATSIFDEFFSDSFFSGGGFFARRENRLLKPPPIALNVRPFPDRGKPEGFRGAVGNFRLSASIDRKTVKQDEPVTMTVVIEGEGNIETLNKPELPELAHFKIYDADTSSQLFKTGNVIAGRKTSEIVFIPIKSGRLVIPKTEFSFFDPATASYRTLYTPEFVLDVSPSDQTFKLPASLSQQDVFKKEVKVEGKDIRYIREKLPDAWATRIFAYGNAGIFAVNVSLTVLVLFGLIREHREKLFAKDNALRRRRYARSRAESRMRRLKPLLHSKDPKDTGDFFDEVGKILTRYLSDKFNLSTHGVTEQELERRWAGAIGTEDPLYKEVIGLYRICEESRFARAQVSSALRTKALKILRDTIRRAEKVQAWKQK